MKIVGHGGFDLSLEFISVATLRFDLMWYLNVLILVQSCSLVDIGDDHTGTEKYKSQWIKKVLSNRKTVSCDDFKNNKLRLSVQCAREHREVKLFTPTTQN